MRNGLLKSAKPPFFSVVLRLLEVLRGNRLSAQNHRDRFLPVDRRLIGERMRQRIILILQHQRPLARLGPALRQNRRSATNHSHRRQQTHEFLNHKRPISAEIAPSVENFCRPIHAERRLDRVRLARRAA